MGVTSVSVTHPLKAIKKVIIDFLYIIANRSRGLADNKNSRPGTTPNGCHLLEEKV